MKNRYTLTRRVIASIIGTTIAVSLMNGIAFAAQSSYSVEAETGYTGNWVYTGGSVVRSHVDMSGGSCLMLRVNPALPKEYYVEYNVNVSDAGYYMMTLTSTPPTVSEWASPICMSVNGSDMVELYGTKNAVVSSSLGVSDYASDVVYMNSGSNKIRFTVKDRNNQGYYYAVIDKFELTPSNIALEAVYSDQPYMTYEYGTDTDIYARMNGIVNSDINVSYSVKDYLGASIKNGTATVEAGGRTGTISLGELPMGAYIVTASYNGASVSNSLSIVVPVSNRNAYSDTPFAVDTNFFGLYNKYSENKNYLDDYVEALKLMGVTWIRDRISLSDAVCDENGNVTVNLVKNVTIGNKVRAGSNIKISSVINTLPDWVSNEYMADDDMTKVYSLFKAVGDALGNSVDCIEILNETDHGGTTTANDNGPDMYASFLKAATIGIKDSASDAIVVSQGAARWPTSERNYSPMLYENNIFDYASADNYHFHSTIDTADYNEYTEFPGIEGLSNIKAVQAECNSAVPVWVTEAGYLIKKAETEELSVAEQDAQARYLVTSAVESVANGTDKHFWFLGTVYQDGDYTTGFMNKNRNYPAFYPAMPAVAAMTHILGKGDYIGTLNSGSVCSYVFNDNGETAVIMYTTGSNANITVSTDANTAVKYDMFGNSENLEAVDGNYTIAVSKKPVYLKFTGTVKNVTRKERSIKAVDLNGKSLNTSQRVVITQRYSDNAVIGSRSGGYFIDGDDNTVTVTITNLNPSTVTGTLNGESDSAWSISPAKCSFSVGSYESKDYVFSISPRGESNTSVIYFNADINGASSPSTAAYVYCGDSYNRENDYKWMQAVKFTDKTGLYRKYIDDSLDHSIMRLFSYGITNPRTDNSLSYSFTLKNSGKYDIWMLSTRSYADWMTKWKWKYDNNNYAYYTGSTNVTSDITISGQTLYWYPVRKSVSLTAGNHSVSVLGDEQRVSSPQYLYQMLDSIVIVPSGSGWSPVNNRATTIISYEQKALKDSFDFSNLQASVELPTKTQSGANLTWSSSDSNVITDKGVITRSSELKTAILTATIKYASSSANISFNVSVAPSDSSECTVNVDFVDSNQNKVISLAPNKTNYVNVNIVNPTNSVKNVDVYISKHLANGRYDECIAMHSYEVEKNSSVNDLISLRLTNDAKQILVYAWNENLSPYVPFKYAWVDNGLINAPEIEGNSITVSGKTNTPNELISLMIVKNADAADNIPLMSKSEIVENVCYIGQTKTDVLGGYVFNFTLKDIDDSYVVRVATDTQSGIIPIYGN